MIQLTQILEIKKHPNADKLDLAKILGYQCVVPKDVYKPLDYVWFIEPDSCLPKHNEWAKSYLQYCPTRIKAIKLRGEWSEGLVISYNELLPYLPVKEILDELTNSEIAERLGITHYEPPAPNDLQAKRYLPFSIPKTDEYRYESVDNSNIPYNELVDITRKVDGQSCSFYYNIETDEFGVLDRSLEMKEECTNNYTAHVERYDIKNKLIAYCKKVGKSLCIRGESYGQGIQGMQINPHSKKNKGWAMFSVWLIDERRYAYKGDDLYFINVAKELNLPTVDIIATDVKLTPEIIQYYSKDIEQLNGESFEGVVINHSAGRFKIINKYYDSKK